MVRLGAVYHGIKKMDDLYFNSTMVRLGAVEINKKTTVLLGFACIFLFFLMLIGCRCPIV